jgi:glycosyltransferase involved in cell wall biosynthesis
LKIIGLLTTYNEQLVIETCIKHHISQGVEIYLIDNESTDNTVDIANKYLGKGVIGIETIPRNGIFDLSRILKRKEELAITLDGDWFMHLDADEMRNSPYPNETLSEAICAVDKANYNAINFMEFTFVPTLESPDHTQGNFINSMKWYYPFQRKLLFRVNAWKKQPSGIDLVSNSGHVVKFPNQLIYPVNFQLRHYQYLNVEHAIQKYSSRRHPKKSLAEGRHGWREELNPQLIKLPSDKTLNMLSEDNQVKYNNPKKVHLQDYQSGIKKMFPFSSVQGLFYWLLKYFRLVVKKLFK